MLHPSKGTVSKELWQNAPFHFSLFLFKKKKQKAASTLAKNHFGSLL